MSGKHRLLSGVAAAMLVAGVGCTAVAPAAAPLSNAPPSSAPAAPGLSPALPGPDDLSFGEAAGSVLIGLTLRPAQPGPNSVLVYVMPLEGPVAAADVPVTLSVAGSSIPLETCSRTCRTANVSLLGGEHIDVTAGGATGGTASFDLPSLPAADGAALLQQVQDRMHQLHSYRVDETLGPATPPLRTAYTFVAPDRMQLVLPGGAMTEWIGPTRYTRQADGGPWQTERFGTSLPVPSFTWDIPESGGSYVGPHMVGSETVDGVQTQVLTFFLDLPQTPAWFRLWSDASGLVHRASMRAPGHFMEHRYTDFDIPASIEPPVG